MFLTIGINDCDTLIPGTKLVKLLRIVFLITLPIQLNLTVNQQLVMPNGFRSHIAE